MAQPKFVALGFVASLLGCCAQRKFPDEEVQASQGYFSQAWRDHYNQGDAVHCGEAYLEDAAVHVDFGPAAAEYKESFGWSSPLVLRGRKNITEFWETSLKEKAFPNLHAYEKDTDSTSFIVDDDTVIVESKFASDTVSGRILSETWLRKGAEWKMMSAMWEIEGKGSHVAVAVEELETALTDAVEEKVPRKEEEVEAEVPANMSNATVTTATADSEAAVLMKDAKTVAKAGGDVALIAGIVAFLGLGVVLVSRAPTRKAQLVEMGGMLG